MPMIDGLVSSLLNWIDNTAAFPTEGTTVQLALSTTTPTSAGANITEPNGGDGYSRQTLALAAVSGGARANSGTITFGPASASWGTITYVVVYIDSTARFYAALTASQAVGNGDSLQFAAGAVSIAVT